MVSRDRKDWVPLFYIRICELWRNVFISAFINVDCFGGLIIISTYFIIHREFFVWLPENWLEFEHSKY